MAWLSGYTLIRVLIAAHLTAGYLLLYSPKSITDQPFVFIVGEAMGMPHPKPTFHLNPLATGILGLVFILMGISDFIAVSSEEEVARGYWSAQAPVRLIFFFLLTGYTYLFKPNKGRTSIQTLDPLKNSLVFTWGFMEVIGWFCIYTQLREEQRAASARIYEQKRLRHEKELAKDGQL